MKSFELKRDKNYKKLDIIDFSERFKFLAEYFYKQLAISFYNALKKEIRADKFGTIYSFLEPILCKDDSGDYSLAFIINEVKKQVMMNEIRKKKMAEIKKQLDEKYKELKAKDYKQYVVEYRNEYNKLLKETDEEIAEQFNDREIYEKALGLEFGLGERKRRYYLNAYNSVMRREKFDKLKKDIESILFDYYMRLKSDTTRIHRIEENIQRSFEEFSKKVLGFE